MLKQIRLGNYKSYKDTTIDVKPITLFCGGNSSGKTAIIKSILLMKQSFEASGNNYLLINGPYTNNGLFTNVRRSTSEPTDLSGMQLSMSFVLEKNNPSFSELCRSIGMTSKQDHFQKFELHAEFSFEENRSIPQVGDISSSTITLFSHYTNNAEDYEGKCVTTEICMRPCANNQHYTIELNCFPFPLYRKGNYPFEYTDESWDKCTCYFRGMQLVSLYKEYLSKKSISALPVLYTIFRILSSEFEKVEYIGPFRETPLRQYFIQDVYSEIGVKGENTAHYLGQFGDKRVRVILPNSEGEQSVELKDAVAEWASFMGIEKVSTNSVDIPGAKLTQIMVGEQNIVDVGFGVSQVLPILVEGLTMAEGNTFILEQPEIHLHPKMQMDIADFLISLVQQEKHLIIETHSDHIINRIIRRALEGKIPKEMIGIFYIEKDTDGNSQLTEVEIHENLGIDVAPQGFFDQYASETEHILQAGYRNLKSKRGGQ